MTNWDDQTTLIESAGPTVEAWVDGSCLNNGEPDAISKVGCVIKSSEEEDPIEIHGQIDLEGRATSNLTEYLAVIAALDRIQKDYSTNVVVRVYTDSEVVVRQLQGIYQVNSGLEEIHSETKGLLNEFPEWRIEQRSESDATEIERADDLARDVARGGSE
jgi:ribonuclease HI